MASPAGAATKKVTLDAGGSAAQIEDAAGIPSSNPRVKPILEAHPNDFVVICVAGCDGKPKAVQILPRPIPGRTGEYVPTSAATPAPLGKSVYGPPQPRTVRMSEETNDVICLAGCMGKPGSILQRINDLPPQPQPKSEGKARKVLPDKPSDKP
jgi:hypothetical protein